MPDQTTDAILDNIFFTSKKRFDKKIEAEIDPGLNKGTYAYGPWRLKEICWN